MRARDTWQSKNDNAPALEEVISVHILPSEWIVASDRIVPDAAFERNLGYQVALFEHR